MALFHPTIQPKVHIPDITHPTLYSTTALHWFRGSSYAPPPFISNEPPLCTEPLPDPRPGVPCVSPTDPNSVGPSQPPLNFVDGNGYIVLWVRGVEANRREVGWGKVMRAWGRGDEKVVEKILELLCNAGLSEEQARDRALPRRWQSKGSLQLGVGRRFFKKIQPPPRGKCP